MKYIYLYSGNISVGTRIKDIERIKSQVTNFVSNYKAINPTLAFLDVPFFQTVESAKKKASSRKQWSLQSHWVDANRWTKLIFDFGGGVARNSGFPERISRLNRSIHCGEWFAGPSLSSNSRAALAKRAQSTRYETRFSPIREASRFLEKRLSWRIQRDLFRRMNARSVLGGSKHV